MKYKMYESLEAMDDVTQLARYLMDDLNNPKAAARFMGDYDRQVHQLERFPFGYRGVSFEYLGYEIRIKTFSSYNLFFIVDTVEERVLILRVLKDRQDWRTILKRKTGYRF